MVRINLQNSRDTSTGQPAGQRGGRVSAAPRSASSVIQNAEPIILPWAIIRDLRERAAGWTFAGLFGSAAEKHRPLIVPLVDRHLVTADYTIDGIPIYIERKSADDFLSTIIHGRENFEKEHERLVDLQNAGASCMVIIEANLDAILNELESGTSARRIHPNSVKGTVESFIDKFNSIPWLFAGSRRLAEEMAFGVLRKAWERGRQG